MPDVPASADTGGAAPASAPSTPDVSSTPSSGGSDYSGLGATNDSFDDITVEVPVDSGGTPLPTEPSQAATPPEPVQPVVATPPQPAPQPGPKEPAQPVASAPSEAPSTPSEPKTLVEELAKNRNDIINALAAERFALSKEEEDAIELSPAAAIPKIMSRVYFEATTAMLNHIQNFVPVMIQQFNALKAQHDEAETAFYGKFSQIDRNKHNADVVSFAKAFRQANPELPREDLFALIGAAVMAKHGLVNGAAAPTVSNGRAPAPLQQQPFVPAPPGASVRITPEGENEWAGLGRGLD